MATQLEEIEKREAEVFTRFIAKKKVLIADANAAARSSLFHVLRELGAHPNYLFLVNTFEHAEQMIQKLKPSVVLTEFDLDKKCGLDLLRKQREENPDSAKDQIFVIVTSNNSQSAASRALEEEIDAYILKPYTLESVRKTLMRAALAKVSPSPYARKILEGKTEMENGNLDEAQRRFQEALPLDSAPTLAHAYLGKVQTLKAILNAAEGSYQKGLSYNKIHYRCLVGLYEILLRSQKNEQAYQIVRRLAKYFPANPDRLVEVLRLAVVTGQYDDIEQYYQVFTSLDERNEEVLKYVCASLIVCGRYYLSTKLGHIRAIELFRKAAIASQGKTKYLKEIILTLIDYRLFKEAAEFLTRFPPEAATSDDFLLLRFLVFSGYGALSFVLDQGRALIAKGVINEKLYEVMIQKELEAKHEDAAEQLLYDACRDFPDRRSHFEVIFRRASPP